MFKLTPLRRGALALSIGLSCLAGGAAFSQSEVGIERTVRGNDVNRVYRCTDCDAAVFTLEMESRRSSEDVRSAARTTCRQSGFGLKRIVEISTIDSSRRNKHYVVICATR